MKWINWGCLAALMLLFQYAAAAEVTGDNQVVRIKGEIVAGDFQRVVREAYDTLELRGYDHFTIDLNSPGGDVVEALKIAQFARDMWAETRVLPATNSMSLAVFGVVTCDSACTLIFLAGTTRYGFGWNEINGEKIHPIGLHRPSFQAEAFSKLSPVMAKQIYQALEENYKTAMIKYGAPVSLVDRTFRTSSRYIDRVPAEELYRDYISFREPWFEEYIEAKCPGLTVEEEASMINQPSYEALQSWKNQNPELMARMREQNECEAEVLSAHRKQAIQAYVGKIRD